MAAVMSIGLLTALDRDEWEGLTRRFHAHWAGRPGRPATEVDDDGYERTWQRLVGVSRSVVSVQGSTARWSALRITCSTPPSGGREMLLGGVVRGSARPTPRYRDGDV